MKIAKGINHFYRMVTKCLSAKVKTRYPWDLHRSPVFSPPKLFKGFILRNLNFLAPRILHAKYQCILANGS